jgi:type IV pilus assembly protein PilX
MSPRSAPARFQRGMALVTSLILLLIITIIALSMFRSFGSQEKIAGNLREKDRALHAAVSAEQYAEWWLTTPNGAIAAGSPVTCTAAAAVLNANNNEGQICTLASALTNLMGLGSPIGAPPNGYVAQIPLPWPTTYVQYSPPGMSTPAQPADPNGDPAFAWTPGFYITDLGQAADAQGEAYLIDAFSSGATSGTVAVVESTYEVQQGVVNRGGL